MKKDVVHEFQKSLKRGKKGEQAFYDLFADKVEWSDGYVADFTIKKNGMSLDLKTDFYDPSKSENFFIERYSYNDEPGGAHQALKKGVHYYVYFFPVCNLFYVFKVKDLVREIDRICKDQYLINVRNTNHITRGYKVPRHLLEHINLSLEDIL